MRPIRPWLLALVPTIALSAASAHAEEPITVFAAASLKAPMDTLADAWAKKGHPKLRVSYESSADLARGIQQGAEAHIFISADEKWMDYLAKLNLLVKGSRRDLLTNTLVLVAPADTAKPVALVKGFDLAAILGPKGRLAIADPDTVPAGIYGKEALTSLGAWDYAKLHLAPAANVKAALVLVDKGEAPAGIVYGTDARNDPAVKIIGTFPATSHDPITYPIALISQVREAKPARAALAFLTSAAAKAVYRRYGFGVK